MTTSCSDDCPAHWHGKKDGGLKPKGEVVTDVLAAIKNGGHDD
jgi:hypothetical protein